MEVLRREPRSRGEHRTPPESTIRVPLLGFARFLDDPRLAGHVVDLFEYYRDLDAGTLPSVAYVVANGSSENPPARLDKGEDLVRDMTGELAKSRYWSSSAFLWTYSGGGGWYDHVPPPTVDDEAGFRVPAPHDQSVLATAGEVNHTTLDTPGSSASSRTTGRSRHWARVTRARRDSARLSTSPLRRVRPSWSAPTGRNLR